MVTNIKLNDNDNKQSNFRRSIVDPLSTSTITVTAECIAFPVTAEVIIDTNQRCEGFVPFWCHQHSTVKSDPLPVAIR